jgi:hypothetical protein
MRLIKDRPFWRQVAAREARICQHSAPCPVLFPQEILRDDGGAELPFGQVVGRGHVFVLQKGEEVIALFPEAHPDFFFLRLGARGVEQFVGS